MDIDDYYFQTKNSKRRKYEGSSRRKGQTIRKSGQNHHGRVTVEVVEKNIKTTKQWDEERINDYCENVLEDGGIPPHVLDYLNNGLSMKKQKRWALSNRIRDAMYKDIDDEQAPDVLLVERAVAGKGNYYYTSRARRANATRATYATSSPINDVSRTIESKEDIPRRRIVDRMPNRKHRYSYPEDLTGCPTMRHRRGKHDENERPKVTYEFCYASPPDRAPGDFTSTKTCYLKYASKKPGYLDQIEEYYHSEKHGIDWASDGEETALCYPQEGEVEQVEVQRTKEILIDSLIQSKKSDPGRLKKGRKTRQTSVSETEESTRNVMKGKIVQLDESENHFPSYDETQQSVSSMMNISFKMDKTALDGLILAHKERLAQNLIEIANLRPIAFTADLRPHRSNGIQNEPCHFVFQTDFDPDTYEQEKEDACDYFEEYVVDVSLFCWNEEQSKLLGDHMQEFSAKKQSIQDLSDLEVFILCAKQIVEESLQEVKQLSAQDTQPQVKEGARDTITPQDVRRDRISLTIKGISEQIGLAPENTPLENLLPKDTFSEEDDNGFEVISNPSAGKECVKCNKRFGGQDEKGLSLAACRHWFCKSCWAKHIAKSEEFFPNCVEVECRAKANMSAKIILCSLTRRRKSVALVGKLDDKIAHKCPRSTCDYVTTTHESTRPLALWCPCKKTWCGECGADPHWPASCTAARRYALELTLLKRKTLFEAGKICPKCGEVALSELPKGYQWRIPVFDSINNCWKTSRSFDSKPFRDHHRCERVLHQSPLQRLFFADGFRFDKGNAIANHEIFGKYHDAIWKNEPDKKARTRAVEYLNEGGKQELMTVVDDLILVKNQVYYVLLFTHVSLRYDHSPKNSQRTKFLVGMSKKMEVLVGRINYLLLRRDYNARDSLFPTTYQSLAAKGKRLVKDLFQATAMEK